MEPSTTPVGFAEEEVATDRSTRDARLKWVVVVDADLAPGLAVNAVACIAASTGDAVEHLLARGGTDADGVAHRGLPWAGCSVLAASAEQLADLHVRAAASLGVLTVAMPAAAQRHRIYDDYLAELATTPTADLQVGALSIVGPKNRIDKLVKKLPLL